MRAFAYRNEIMRHFPLVFLLVPLGCTTFPPVPKRNRTPPELFAFITQVEDQAYLNLRITNRGPKALTVPTGAPGLSSTDFPRVSLRFTILKMGTLEGKRKWKFVPSITDLRPVTLKTDETATMSVKLNGKMWAAKGEQGKQEVTISYVVDKDMAERFGLWEGSLDVQETLFALRHK